MRLYTLQEHLHNHEIVIPRKVDHLGDLISHNVTHHHHEDGPIVHYRVAVAGNEYHLELMAADNFIGSAMVVERRKRDLHVRSLAKNHSSKCHYRGFIKGHRNSRVALSACDGLVTTFYAAKANIRVTFAVVENLKFTKDRADIIMLRARD
ncbi:A disintegrin and metalloproteinase with thrombospondin motifs [Ooceraea biroi]|uniref:A disintegrin and metalloproteinase with thrombospondin motifs n=1 Tax=Ooceraea biroi TaxID=2015173 RepID=A0A026WNI2_OOCBI|nr:A disintegrin and metalloproteinase with thrombospondin motifs [Ooceraea biroi]